MFVAWGFPSLCECHNGAGFRSLHDPWETPPPPSNRWKVFFSGFFELTCHVWLEPAGFVTSWLVSRWIKSKSLFLGSSIGLHLSVYAKKNRRKQRKHVTPTPRQKRKFFSFRTFFTHGNFNRSHGSRENVEIGFFFFNGVESRPQIH